MKTIKYVLFTPGLMIIACFTFVKLGFVFYLVDTIFRFTIMVVMLPILIMGYPFGPTKKWLSQGFVTILNSAAFMMFMAIMIAIAMLALEQIIIDNADIFENGTDKDFKEFSILVFLQIRIQNHEKTVFYDRTERPLGCTGEASLF